MTVFSLRHHTTKAYLICLSDGGVSLSPDEALASTWPDRHGVEQAHMALGSFASCWKITEIDRPVDPTPEVV